MSTTRLKQILCCEGERSEAEQKAILLATTAEKAIRRRQRCYYITSLFFAGAAAVAEFAGVGLIAGGLAERNDERAEYEACKKIIPPVVTCVMKGAGAGKVLGGVYTMLGGLGAGIGSIFCCCRGRKAKRELEQLQQNAETAADTYGSTGPTASNQYL